MEASVAPQGVALDDFRETLSHVPSPVTIVTTLADGTRARDDGERVHVALRRSAARPGGARPQVGPARPAARAPSASRSTCSRATRRTSASTARRRARTSSPSVRWHPEDGLPRIEDAAAWLVVRGRPDPPGRRPRDRDRARDRLRHRRPTSRSSITAAASCVWLSDLTTTGGFRRATDRSGNVERELGAELSMDAEDRDLLDLPAVEGRRRRPSTCSRSRTSRAGATRPATAGCSSTPTTASSTRGSSRRSSSQSTEQLCAAGRDPADLHAPVHGGEDGRLATRSCTSAAIYLNMLAGGFKNDLIALDDETPHDDRYVRTVEYTQIMKALLVGPEPVTLRGRVLQGHEPQDDAAAAAGALSRAS